LHRSGQLEAESGDDPITKRGDVLIEAAGLPGCMVASLGSDPPIYLSE
jgi:hypothetical protein